jgi:benzil reductase ((S)-benzoin forming)
MPSIYIITGTSRGIGRAVAARLLETGNRVFGISRSPSPLAGERGFRAVQGSVTDPSWVGPLLEEVRGDLAEGEFDMLCLLNNAAVLEPMGAIEHCDAQAIRHHVEVNLTAPMVLTAQFMAAFADLDLRRKVVHMTSGAAHRPIPDMSLYCATKAGISMFCACVGAEQDGSDHGYEIAAISPGMVETDMQRDMRARSAEEFRPSEQFRAAKADGAVQDPAVVARKICAILEARTEMGGTVRVAEWPD